MNALEMQSRTKAFGLRIIRLVQSLPPDRVTDVMAKQLLRCGTSVGANYRAVARARSHADFVNKLGIVEEEADESSYWLELLMETGVVPEAKLAPLLQESNEITSIIVASIRKAKQRARSRS